MTQQVEGQMALSDEYEAWRAVPAMGDMASDARADDAADRAWSAEMPEEVEAEERALVTTTPQTGHHLITGMAALARMDESEFQNAMAAIETGQKRMAEFQRRAMVRGEDYGVVKGIDRPFLHLPGAEKMTLLYGLAARQEAERIVGDGVTAPPLTYHVKTYVHVGSFDGPIVAMGYGESSSWEVKYRYQWSKPACPECSREGLIKGKPDGKLAGKWWCPGRNGGCNRTFEPADPRIVTGKVENTDPWSLAETLLQMAAKRSFVAATRRATGTSGLFTQDEDSPNVQEQADQSPDTASDDVAVEPVTDGTTVSRGGKADQPTPTQIARLAKISKEKDLGPQRLMDAISHVLGMAPIELTGDRGAMGRTLLAFIQSNLTADQLGAVLHHLETGEIVDPVTAAMAPDKATN